ncbi:MAG: preprotein translocase subunit SecA [Clostridia bacterium]|nr:preprotein translocase subunit SecA [Clostridia bacterium]
MFGLFMSDNKRSLKKLEKMAKKVEDLEPKYQQMTNEELQRQTAVLKDRLKEGETLDDILYDAFAVAREASFRVLNMKHFHVQIIGGIVLHQGRIAEMYTGEGKTFVAVLPSYLNALTEKGVHVVTVNEYLATRDAEWMGKVHKFLGLSVGVSLAEMNPKQKQKAYACDITYCTNNELGFDYLRDNMVRKAEDRVCRGYNFAIIDEVDSILIDEARTPLIISGRGFKSSENYKKAQRFIRTLRRDEDYVVDEEKKAIHLTEDGNSKAEKFFNIENLSDIGAMELNQHIMNALRANFMLKRDSDYIVNNGEVLLVDEFTGRVMEGRRYSNGLHQAIEAKEGVEIKDENLTVATITLQNFFRLYKKLSGMTGTAKTEEGEFNKIYNLDIVTIPQNLPNKRVDEPDIVYTTMEAKYKAIVDRIEEAHENLQPVLVGTTTIEKSEYISKLLKQRKIPHNVLNAKNHAQESEIIAQAGQLGKVTIATNMAGRGTDILLGGNPNFLAKAKLVKKGYNHAIIEQATSFLPAMTDEVQEVKDEYEKAYAELKTQTDLDKQKVIEAGGLLIIGTERHESRRIDNQLRGRAGRQGDPGHSVFYLSLEDDLLRLFGGDRLKRISNFFKLDDDVPFQMKMLSHQISNAQKKVEIRNYSIRKHLIGYDDVINEQRTIIYDQRNKILDGEDVHAQILEMFPEVVQNVILSAVDDNKPSFDWDIEEINHSLEDRLYPKGSNFVTQNMLEDISPKDLVQIVLDDVLRRYDEKKAEFEEIGLQFAAVERIILLDIVDRAWMEHIDAMTVLRHEIVTQGFGNVDPVIAYKKEGFEMFDKMVGGIREKVSTIMLNLSKPTVEIRQAPTMKNTVASQETTAQPANSTPAPKGPAVSNKIVGRNEPCPCGSGKKYKNCCGRGE